MKNRYSVCVLTSVMALSTSLSVKALAVVESRTGEPIVSSAEPVFAARSAEGHAANDYAPRPSKAVMNAPAEDRAALLSLKQLETLKQEIGELRGLVETQEHEIQQLKKSQQDFYSDLDKRITQSQSMNKGVTNSKTAPVPATKKSGITIVPTGKSAAVPKEEAAEEAILGPMVSDFSESASPNQKKSNIDQTTEKATYEAAYELVKTKRYSEATAAFQNYLTRFKTGEHAANAHYWMGEIYMVEWQKDAKNKALLDKAATAFSNVVSQFPGNPKVSDALLKLGIVESEKGNSVAARKYFMDVKSRYPGSAAARIAEARLKQL